MNTNSIGCIIVYISNISRFILCLCVLKKNHKQTRAIRFRKSKSIRFYKMHEEDRKKYKTLKEFARHVGVKVKT